MPNSIHDWTAVLESKAETESSKDFETRVHDFWEEVRQNEEKAAKIREKVLEQNANRNRPRI